MRTPPAGKLLNMASSANLPKIFVLLRSRLRTRPTRSNAVRARPFQPHTEHAVPRQRAGGVWLQPRRDVDSGDRKRDPEVLGSDHPELHAKTRRRFFARGELCARHQPWL